jgi:pimeloyl-ACP methyl ester carboxylesterase
MVRVALTLKRAELAYEVTGAGEPVLLLHGLGGTRHDWRAQLPALAQRYRVVTCDLPGHGASDPPRRHSIAQYAHTVALLMRALELGPMHVVGLSLGGMVGFQLALDHPELLLSLCVVNSAPEVRPRGLRQRLRIASRLMLAQLVGPRGMAALIARRLFPKPGQAALRRETERVIAANDRHAYLQATRAIVGWSVADRLDAVACPTLVVSGDRDYTTVAEKRAWMRALDHAELVVIADSGHATPLDQPVPFNRELLHFLDRITGEAPPLPASRTNAD